jgi:hypothetical protein
MTKFPFQRWDLIAWAVWAGAFFALEGIGLYRKEFATLTALVRASVPAWIRASFIGWLAYHFLVQK